MSLPLQVRGGLIEQKGGYVSQSEAEERWEQRGRQVSSSSGADEDKVGKADLQRTSTILKTQERQVSIFKVS